MGPLMILILLGIIPLVLFIYRRFVCRLAVLNLAGPEISPFLGDIVEFQKSGYQLHLLVDKYYKKYGNLFAFYHQGEPVVCVSDEKVVPHILKKHFQNFCNRKFFIDLPEPCHKMITMMPASESKSVRNLLLSILKPTTIMKLMQYFHSATDTVDQKLEETADDKEQEIDVVSFAHGYIMEILAKLTFSLDVPNQSELNNTLVQLSESFCKPPYWVNLIAALPFGRHVVKYIPTTYKNQLQPTIDIAVNLVTERRKDKDSSSKQDILAALLSAQEANSDLTDSVLLAQGLVLLTAVHILTSNTIAIAMYYIAKHTEVQDQLQDEIDQLSRREDFPNWEDVQHNLPYLDNVIKEVLRLYPSGFMLTRECTESITIENISFKKGDVVLIPTYSIHRDNAIYENAETFDPNRFKEKDSPAPYYTFGEGMRGCIGRKLAFAEIKVFLSRILSKYNISMSDENQQIDVRSHFTVQAMLSVEQSINVKISSRYPKPATP